MKRATPLWPRLALAGALLLMLAGLVQLFRDRFATGDVYPEYSSLRGDPLGTRVLYESFEAAGIEVARNFRDVARADPGQGTIFLCGLHWSQITGTDTEDVKALLASVRAGSRLVLGFAPQAPEVAVVAGAHAAESADRERERRHRAPSRQDKPEARPLHREFGIDTRWLPATEGGVHTAARVGADALPDSLPWHTALAFEPEGDAWRRVYGVDRYAAILERSYGRGSIVLVGDAYLLSNEAMARGRQSALLAWLLGPSRRVVFDETHLGVEENTGIAALARRYGLAHTALALIAVAVLYFWKNGTSLVPPAARGAVDAGELAGRDASSGLVNLLRRTLPAGELVAACVAEYKRAAAWRRLAPETQRALETLALSAGGDRRRVPEAMRAAHELLKRKS